MIIKIKYLSGIEKLKKIAVGDWIDLRCACDVHMKEGEYMLIPLGVAMELPQGYEAHIVPRSSTFKNFGVIQTNGMGVIDNTYCGDNDEWKFPAYATRNTVIHKNDRLCQFRIVQSQQVLQFIEVDHLYNADRNGLGSTGIQ